MGYFKKISAFLVYAMCYHENVHNKINAVYIEHWVKENGLECGFVEHWLSSVYVNGPKISQMYIKAEHFVQHSLDHHWYVV